MTESTTPITFLDPQPQPGDSDRVWFAKPRSGTGIYAVTRAHCSCPWGAHHPDDFLAKPCAHWNALMHLLDELPEPDESVEQTRR